MKAAIQVPTVNIYYEFVRIRKSGSEVKAHSLDYRVQGTASTAQCTSTKCLGKNGKITGSHNAGSEPGVSRSGCRCERLSIFRVDPKDVDPVPGLCGGGHSIITISSPMSILDIPLLSLLLTVGAKRLPETDIAASTVICSWPGQTGIPKSRSGSIFPHVSACS